MVVGKVIHPLHQPTFRSLSLVKKCVVIIFNAWPPHHTTPPPPPPPDNDDLIKDVFVFIFKKRRTCFDDECKSVFSVTK